MSYTATLRNQFIAKALTVDARHLEQLLNQVPALPNRTIAAWLGRGEGMLTNLLATAPTSAALAAIPPLTTTNV